MQEGTERSAWLEYVGRLYQARPPMRISAEGS